MADQRAVIIGAGPAGLTAAYELLKRTGLKPVVLERDDIVGGISRTVEYNGNRIDIGGHRFFSKSDRVMEWWLSMLPLDSGAEEEFQIGYQGGSRTVHAGANVVAGDPEDVDSVMLVRPRKSRIFYLRRFFDYPLRPSLKTFFGLGALRTSRILASYLWARLFPIRDEQNLEDFFINRFGCELYKTFFRSYTEKVWGVPCREISAAWGAQRIKGLSIGRAIRHALRWRRTKGVAQKDVETSLVERFLYPKFGPGQMWETCADRVRRMGGELLMRHVVERIVTDGSRVTGVVARNGDGEILEIDADLVFSTMPVVDLVRGFDDVPETVRAVADGLVYRDFLTVGLLVRKLAREEVVNGTTRTLRDNWVYIQEPDVRIGRLQIFNNWSPWMVRDPETVWLGLEYFCNEGDDLWIRPDDDLVDLGTRELASMGLIDETTVIDATVIRMPKTYPAYFGSYDRFDEIRDWVGQFSNLVLLGRNGMHRYNNQDHSMLTAMVAVDNIVAGRSDHSNVWDVNVESEYHEARTPDSRTNATAHASTATTAQ